MPAKILVVDDEPDLELLIPQIFEDQIEHNEFQFVFAHDGKEALQTLTTDPDFDLVLTDINMPEMDGLALLGQLQEKLQEHSRLLKAVVISAHGDMSNIREAMRCGAFDFLTKPFNLDELELTIERSLKVVQELKTAWEREQELQRNLRQFLDALPVGVLVITPERKIFYVNHEAVKIYGLPNQNINSIIGQKFPEELETIAKHKRCQAGTTDRYPTEKMPIVRALKGEENPSVEDIEIRRPNGDSPIPLAVSAKPIRNQAREIIYAIAALQDITARKQTEAERLRRAEAEQADHTKTLFLANTSHELRTPLTAIISLSETLEEADADLTSEQRRHFAQKIIHNSKFLRNIINDLLDLSKIVEGRMEILPEMLEICPMVQEVVDTIASLAEKNGNTLTVACPVDIGTMYADGTRIRQCLHNLLSNASKFTEQGTITFEVSRHSKAGQDWITFRVSDTGIGMTAAQQQNLFKPFTQGDLSTTRKYGGTGLGLSITKQLCDMMGGQIEVESERDRGSTFTIHLPISSEDRS